MLLLSVFEGFWNVNAFPSHIPLQLHKSLDDVATGQVSHATAVVMMGKIHENVLQLLVKIEAYSVAYFDRIAVFKAQNRRAHTRTFRMHEYQRVGRLSM